MATVLKKLDPDVQESLAALGDEADRQGLELRLVGGMVRDALLGRASWDVDLVLEGDAIRFAERCSRTFRVPIMTYPRFRTATLMWSDRLQVDCVTARRETYPAPGALPRVVPGSFDDDVVRRDFTVNALAVCLNWARRGEVIDRCRGQEDLDRGIIRVFHEGSFRDDPTRMIRAIRFEQRLGFRLERATATGLREGLAGSFYRTVSAPRYYAEWRKIFAEDAWVRCLRRFWNLGGGDFLGGLRLDPGTLRRVDQWLRQALERRAIDALEAADARWLAVFHMASAAQRDEWRLRFQMTRHERRLLNALHEIEELSGIGSGEIGGLLKAYPKLVVWFWAGLAHGAGRRRLEDVLMRTMMNKEAI